MIFSNQSAGTCDLEVQLLQDPGHAALPPQVDAQGDLHQPSHASYQQLSQLCHILPSGGKVSVFIQDSFANMGRDPPPTLRPLSLLLRTRKA